MPEWKEEVRKRLSDLKLAPTQEAEIVEELAQHLEDVYERALRRGASEFEARRAAHQELAGDLLNDVPRAPKPVYQQRIFEPPGRFNLLVDLLHDLRYAARMQRK